MPRAEHLEDIMSRRAEERLGGREWRRYPARKGVRPRRDQPELETVECSISGAGGSCLAEIFLQNRKAEVLRIAVVGTDPEVFIEVDGNQSHRTSIPVSGDASTVEIRRDGRDGEVITSARIAQEVQE